VTLPAMKTCETCGGTYARKKNENASRWGARRFCSRQCSGKFRRDAIIQLDLSAAEKWCPRCQQTKGIAEFPLVGKGRRGRAYGYCRPCHSAVQRVVALKREFNLTEEQYETMLADQGNVCAICLRPPKTKRRLAVDHDHKTGLIRGGLCWLCNRLLGLAADDPERLARAIQYLEHPPAVSAIGEIYTAKGRTRSRQARIANAKRLSRHDAEREAA